MACNEKRFAFNFDLVPRREYSDVKIPPDEIPCNEVKRVSKPIDWDKPISIEYHGEIYPATVIKAIHNFNIKYTVYIVRAEDPSFKDLFFQRDGRFIGWFMTHHDEAMVKFRHSEDIAIKEYPTVVQGEPTVAPFDFSGTFNVVLDEKVQFEAVNGLGERRYAATSVQSIFGFYGMLNRKIVHIVRCAEEGIPDFLFDDYGRCVGMFASSHENEVKFIKTPSVRLERQNDFPGEKQKLHQRVQP